MSDAVYALSIAGVVAGAALLVVAALHDIVARTVPNTLALLIAGAGLLGQAALAASGDTGWAGFGYAVLAAFVVFFFAALMWRRGWMGGGDVKLLGAASLLVPAGLVMTLIAAIAIAGGVLSLLYLAARRRLPPPRPGRPLSFLGRVVRTERWRLRRGGPLPYAVAIASGAFFVLMNGGLP